MAVSTNHNKYVSIPDWFSNSSSAATTTTQTPSTTKQTVIVGGGGGGIPSSSDYTNIPIDNQTIVWSEKLLKVPIDNNKLVVKDGVITLSDESGTATGLWELRLLTDGTNYIYTTYPVVTLLGITMYAGNDGLDIPSIAEGLPFDEKTIRFNESTGLIEVIGGTGGGEEGTSNFWELDNIPSWITVSKPTYSYSEILGIPDLSNYVTITDNEPIYGIKDFINGIKINTLSITNSQDDVIYIDANLVVRGGITMYADNTVDIPGILDSLPVASTTNKGIASFDGEYFSVSNGKVTLLEGNVGLNEAELAAYLSNNKYATLSWVQSLGYATVSDLDSRINALVNGAPAAYDTLKEIADVLAGNVDSIGDIITTLGTKWTQDNTKIANWDTAYSWGNHASVGYALKSYVDTEFAKYVTLATAQTISGEKNFTGGLKVNGSPIVYDATNKYWKLEGDLLVTGGVTMYGSDSSFTPSTIMDAILYDNETLGINSNGELYVKSGTGGGVADSVSWDNITGKPTWIGSSKPTYTYSEITNAISLTEVQNYLTSNSYLNVTGGDNRYLKLSGGELNGSLSIGNNTTTSQLSLSVARNKEKLSLLISGEKEGWLLANYEDGKSTALIQSESSGLMYKDTYGRYHTIYHIGNLTASSLGLGNVTNLAASGYLTALSSNTTNAVSITVGGTTKNITAATMKSSLGLGSNAYTSTDYLPSASYTSADVLEKLKTVDGTGSGLDADLLDGIDSSSFARNQLMNNLIYSNNEFNFVPSAYSGDIWFNYQTQGGKNGGIKTYYFANGSGSTNVTLNAASFTGNASSATKLQTAITIWGQSFDGTKDIDGSMTLKGEYVHITLQGTNIYNTGINFNDNAGVRRWALSYRGQNAADKDFYIYRSVDGSTLYDAICLLNSNGNVGMGTVSPTQKLDVMGNVKADALYLTRRNGDVAFTIAEESGTNGYNITAVGGLSYIRFYTNYSAGPEERMRIDSYGNIGIGVSIPSAKLHVNGDILATGGITMYSMRALKNVIDERGLSLTELSTIKPTRYTWKDGRDNRLHFGGIADDIQHVLPEVVYKTGDGTLTMDYGNAAFAIASSLIKPVIDHEKRIAMLERENKELRLEVERLKAN